MARRCSALVGVLLLVIVHDARAQESDFLPGELLFRLLPFSDDLQTAITEEIVRFPIGSSSGGFTWSFDPSLGVQTRRSRSFGPIFAERPYTTGARKLNIAIAYQRTVFDKYLGEPLSNIESVVPSGVDFTSRAFHTSDIRIVADRAVASASYGLTDWWDLGVIVPFGRTSVSGSTVFQVRDRRTNALLDSGELAGEASGTGVGDLTIRSKAALSSSPAFGLAAVAEIRLATGDPLKLLGTSFYSGKVMLAAASTLGAVSPHVNVAYVVPDVEFCFACEGQVDYTVGVDIAAATAVTIAADVMGRWVNRGFFFPTNATLGSVGAKVSMGGLWLLTGSLLFPLESDGLTPKPTPVIGFERAF